MCACSCVCWRGSREEKGATKTKRMSRHKCIWLAMGGGGCGGLNSCVISPFKFHKQLHILCAFLCIRTVTWGGVGGGEGGSEDRRRDKWGRGRRGEQKFLLEISATALAWPRMCGARGALRVVLVVVVV